jgi:AcrR family transcriptional regulator
MTEAVDKTVPPEKGHRRYRQQGGPERRAERRGRLITAALDAFSQRGYRATTIEQLCSAAGVSTRNFYEEFAGREALLATLSDILNQRAFDAVVAAIADLDPADLAGRATAGVRAYFEVMTADPRWARIALVESVGVSAEMEAHRRAPLERFAALIEGEANRMVELGRAPTRDYSLTVIALVGATNELIYTWVRRPDREEIVERVINEATRLFLAAVEAA